MSRLIKWTEWDIKMAYLRENADEEAKRAGGDHIEWLVKWPNNLIELRINITVKPVLYLDRL